MRDRRRQGFSLVELLMALALLGLLTAIIVPVLLGARERSRLTSCDRAFDGLDAEIASELEHVRRSEGNISSCGDMGSEFADLQIIRCVAARHVDERNPRNAEQPLYFNYVESPIPYDSCQVGLDEEVLSVGLGVKARQFVAPGAPERSFTVTLD